MLKTKSKKSKTPQRNQAKAPKKKLSSKGKTSRPRDGRHYPTRPVVGVGIVIWRGDKLLLVRRAKAPRAGEWGLPGGVQHLGETIMEAAVREAREETLLDIVPLGIITALDALTLDAQGETEFHYTIVEVVAEANDGDAVAQDDAAAVRWADLKEVDELCKWDEVGRIARLSLVQRVL